MASVIHGRSWKGLKHLRKNPAALAIFWAYCAMANEDNVAWPSLRGLAKMTDWSVNVCGASRRWLVTHGALVPVTDYMRPSWKELPESELTIRRNLDHAEYYRPTGKLTVNGVEIPMLYFGTTPVEQEDVPDVSFGATSSAGEHGPDDTELDPKQDLEPDTPRPLRTTSKTDVVREETGNGSAASASSMTSDRFSILDNSITDVQNAYRSGQLTYDDLPELILREAAGKNRTTLLAWLARKEALGQLEGRYVEMVQAVADVTGLDLTDSGVGGRIGKFIRAALWGAYAKMPYTPEEIQDCFGPNGYWRQKDWRGKQGQAVTLGNVFVETLSKYRQETRHAVTQTASTQTEGFTETWESTGWDPD